MKDLNRYVIRKYAFYWFYVGIELGLDLQILDIIERNNRQQIIPCFQNTLEIWLKRSINATWKTLEVALTNVNRKNLGLDPLSDVYGKDVYQSLF